MAVRWVFLEFDWERFRAVGPRLQQAAEQGGFESLDLAPDLPEAEEILEQMSEDSTPEEACNTLVAALCGVGEPVAVETGLPEMLTHMRRARAGEDAAEILAELISASPGIEPWFQTEAGLAGILDNVQTFTVAVGLTAYGENRRPAAAPRGVAAIASWTRRFMPTEAAEDRMDDLINLVRRAAERQHGLAALRQE